MNFHAEKIERIVELLKENINKTLFDIKPEKYFKCGYKKGSLVPDDNAPWQDYTTDISLKEKDAHFWFKYTVEVPKEIKAKKYRLKVYTSILGWDATNPQCIVYLDGKPTQGLDVNHTEVLLNAGRTYNVAVYFYTGMNQENTSEFFNKLIVEDESVKNLYYDLSTALKGAKCFSDNCEEYSEPIKYLTAAVNMLDLRDIGSKEYYKTIAEARGYLKTEFYEKYCGKGNITVSCIGHTHIDVAWLWTFAQTKEKVQRSFLSVLRLMEEYPEYKFMSSQPQLYQYLKEEAPEVYKEIKERVREGRWEVEGAMWVEADCNLISGESMVRQLMHGKRFIKDEFDIDSRILWLPDVFGYSAAMPQILKKCGVDKFVTSKISWNENNRMPHETFLWKGIDSTSIFTQFMTSTINNANQVTYNSFITPDYIKGAWERYSDKEYSDSVMNTYGWGDGGGGPTRDMLEQQRRLEYGLPGIPRTEQKFAAEILSDIESDFDKNCVILRNTPTWTGELYLEFHRGTYTTMAKNKKNNRECEFLLENAEKLSVFDMILNKGKYDTDTLYKAWETLLLNQFHDVIPGSSIKEVYEASDVMYKEVRNTVSDIINDKLSKLISGEGASAVNLNGCSYTGPALYNGKKYFVRNMLPYSRVMLNQGEENNVSVEVSILENSFYRLSLDENANIVSIYDKRYNREVIKAHTYGNAIEMYEDLPYQYDAWELSDYHKEKKYEINNVSELTTYKDEISAGFIIKRVFSKSTLTQKIIMYSEFERIDFETVVDWHETHSILKAAFPINVNTDKATYEIQFGNTERPTTRNNSWDSAKFEVCAHKWADISDGGYGVGLLNNCKYGHSCEDSVMRLTLLKSSTYPNPDADRGINTFTYSLVPHKGDYRSAHIVQHSYALNNPVICVQGEKGTMPSGKALISCDKGNIIIETVKKAEMRDSIIIRMYDSYNTLEDIKLTLGFEVREAYICDMLEKRISSVYVFENTVNLTASNFEIITLELVL